MLKHIRFIHIFITDSYPEIQNRVIDRPETNFAKVGHEIHVFRKDAKFSRS